MTKIVLESIKLNLHTSYAPFWNEINVSNLLFLSNFWFFGLYWHNHAKHLSGFFLTRLHLERRQIEHHLIRKHIVGSIITLLGYPIVIQIHFISDDTHLMNIYEINHSSNKVFIYFPLYFSKKSIHYYIIWEIRIISHEDISISEGDSSTGHLIDSLSSLLFRVVTMHGSITC